MNIMISVIGAAFIISALIMHQKRRSTVLAHHPRFTSLTSHDILEDAVISDKRIAEEVAVEFNHEPAEVSEIPLTCPIIRGDVAIITLMADTRVFAGYELLQTLLAAGLRFGEMDIFHRYQSSDPSDVIFSVATVEEPGTFDVQQMGACICRGLVFFLRLHPHKNNAERFALLVTTAEQVAADLGGHLCDSNRQILTSSDLTHAYQVIKNAH